MAADPSETLAEQLIQFIKAAGNKASGPGVQQRTSYGTGTPSVLGGEPLQNVFARCMMALTDDERRILGEIIEKLQGTLPTPSASSPFRV